MWVCVCVVLCEVYLLWLMSKCFNCCCNTAISPWGWIQYSIYPSIYPSSIYLYIQQQGDKITFCSLWFHLVSLFLKYVCMWTVVCGGYFASLSHLNWQFEIQCNDDVSGCYLNNLKSKKRSLILQASTPVYNISITVLYIIGSAIEVQLNEYKMLSKHEMYWIIFLDMTIMIMSKSIQTCFGKPIHTSRVS